MTHHLYLCTYSNLTPSPAHWRTRATQSNILFFSFLFCVYLALSVLFSYLYSLSSSSSFVLFFSFLPHVVLFHPFKKNKKNSVSHTFMIFPVASLVCSLCHSHVTYASSTPWGLCLSSVTGGVKPLRHFPLSSGSREVTPASITAFSCSPHTACNLLHFQGITIHYCKSNWFYFGCRKQNKK